ncbi:hypothetical protein [Leptospira jelokensis]|uniref:hypothetical protein n=1 Tax=Leptospira jelokensis TaxID=2484931 RepID=UPI0010913380|nr:hypothetical protein [Leptospira jelokensis]TGM07017.1 hypothetical protein EHQ79_00135 [Leptospira jelokensis]
MKKIITVFLFGIVFSTSVHSQSIFQSQAELRTKKPFSVHIGLNSISNYFYSPLVGFSYLPTSSHEFGVLFVNSKFNESNDPFYLPTQQRFLEFRESVNYDQFSFKFFYNYFLFNSIFFINGTFGHLTSVTRETQFNSIYLNSTDSGVSLGYDSLIFRSKRNSTFYISPGLGLRFALENGVFFTVTGGPMILENNDSKTESSVYYSTTNFERVQNLNLFLNLPFGSQTRADGSKLEAYIDFASGISF